MSATPFVVIPLDELDQRIEAAVRRAIDSRPVERPPEWLDTRGAAELLGVTRRQVAKLAEKGAIPSARVGRLLRLKRADVIAYLEQPSRPA